MCFLTMLKAERINSQNMKLSQYDLNKPDSKKLTKNMMREIPGGFNPTGGTIDN